MNNLAVSPIGKISTINGKKVIILRTKYIPALTGLDGFSYIQVIWWFDRCDSKLSREKMIEKKPYKNGPDIMGTFATRSQERPNPIALTSCYVTHIDYKKGIIGIAYIDASDGSPILDIKPYTPSTDRVENPSVPKWCSNWPRCNEDSGNFNWENEFNF